jgi:hypothetical protein
MQLLLRLARLLFNGVLLFTCVLVGMTFWLQQRDHDLHMKLIPRALQATGIAYQKEQLLGFGPGANESGAIVYSLPVTVVSEINNRPTSFFESLGPDWRDWRPTPVSPDHLWRSDADAEGTPDTSSPSTEYLSRSPAGTTIDPAVRDTIDAAILNPGSYYATTTSGGLIVVAPSRNEAYLLFSG